MSEGKKMKEKSLTVQYAIAFQSLTNRHRKELKELRDKYESQGVSVLIAEKALADNREEERRRKRNKECTRKWRDKKEKK